MSRKYELILFDLDGTLLDTSQGIFNSVRYAEKEMGFTPISEECLVEFVGPPPKMMYMKMYDISEEIAFLAVQQHRKYAKEKAIYEATIYPGIMELLERLKKEGYKLGVATLKAQGIAKKILDYFQIAQYFNVIVGMNEKESLSKKDTIQIAIETTNTTDETLMIGDSLYDYEGAVKGGVKFLGVLYGFGFKDNKNQEITFVKKPYEIGEYIDGEKKS